MALDAGLMDRARQTGEAVFRVYRWSRPTLSFGRNESVRVRFDPASLAAADIGAVRRPTGGRVLMHDREVTYSVTAPARDDVRMSESYRRINAILVAALADLGVVVSAAPAGVPRRPGGAACFAEPSAGELTVNGRKLVGSAQLREHGALLQHGSILLADDQPRIVELAVMPMVPAPPAATLREAIGREIAFPEVGDALRGALNRLEGEAVSLDASEARALAIPHMEKFSGAEWTWRR